MRWNAAVVEMDRYFKTPVLYRNMGIEMFCNFVEESIHEAAFTTYLAMKLRPRATTVKEFGLEISLFSHFYPLNNEPLTVDKVKKLYTLLNSDLSQFEGASLEIIRLAAQNVISAKGECKIHKRY
jgi:hypothetical protein